MEWNVWIKCELDMVVIVYGFVWFKMCMFKSLGHGLGYDEYGYVCMNMV